MIRRSSFKSGVQMHPQEKQELIEFLRKNVDVFAWNAYEDPGIDSDFICHHLNVNPSITPRKQLPKRSSKDHYEAVKDEVTKLKQARAIKEVFYPEWLANTIVVKKKERKVASVRRLHRLEQSLSKRSFPPSSNRPVGGRNSRPSSDEFPGRLSRIPSNTAGLRRSGENSFCHSHWELPL